MPSTDTLSSLKPESIFCCEECDKPLQQQVDTLSGLPSGYYCTECKFTPSMQDTFIKYQCTGCHCELDIFITPNANQVGMFLQCPRCAQLYVRDPSPTD